MTDLPPSEARNDTAANCPKCQADMSQGFIPEIVIGDSQVTVWHEGEPKQSFWGGAKIPHTGAIPIGAYRCSQCGYLELYARREFSPKV